jgi:predicted DNA-binding ribbon-helix-helix protein
MKRSTLVDGHKTSVTLEDEFLTALKEIAATQNVGTPKLISMIDSQRQNNNLSSAIRVYVLSYYRRLAELKRKGNDGGAQAPARPADDAGQYARA